MTIRTSALGDRCFKETTKPWLSVVIPTFNGALFIRQALRPVTAANDEGIECIVVDDGSTDGTRDIVDSYHDTLRLRVEEGPRIGNWAASTNAGVKVAEGDHVTFLHQDDEWIPGRVEVLKSLLRDVPDAALHLHAAKFLSATGRCLGDWTLPFPDHGGITTGRAFIERLLVQNFLCIGAPLFRRQDFLSLGGLDEELWYTADWDLWLRLASLGDVAYDSRPLIGFRVHGNSQTSTRSTDLAEFRRQLETVFEPHFSAWASSAAKGVADSVRRASRASIELNVAMAALSHRSLPPLRPVAAAMASVGLGGARRVARDSRLHQRVGARLRDLGNREDSGSRLRSSSCH